MWVQEAVTGGMWPGVPNELDHTVQGTGQIIGQKKGRRADLLPIGVPAHSPVPGRRVPMDTAPYPFSAM